MKLLDRLRDAAGVGAKRNLPPPNLQLVADGLLVTDTKAEAWFEIPVSNTDHISYARFEGELRAVLALAEKSLAEVECHLKIVWGSVTGAEYMDQAARFNRSQAGLRWAQTRAERIDELNMPERHVLVGIKIADRDPGLARAVSGKVADAVSGTKRTVRRRELAAFDKRMRRLGRSLVNSVWHARPASAETIGWMIGREQHRVTSIIPKDGTLVGSQLARLTRGRIVPYTDHLRVIDGHGMAVAFTSVLALTDFPAEMETPGDGEWLRTLSEVTRIDETGAEVAVTADASIRWQLMARHHALKLIEKTRTSAKEQRRSAERHSAEEPPDDVIETENEMRNLSVRIKREGLTLAHDHDRIIVTEDDYDTLMQSVDAVKAHYADMGITCEIAEDEQRDAWLETLPGDVQRIPDLGHVRDSAALFGSLFWGGSAVGARRGPAPAVMTGSTPGLFHFDVCGGAGRGDATTTMLAGRSGRGKTTAMGLMLLDAVAMLLAWAALVDFKGDVGGLITTARRYGIPAQIIEPGDEYAGSADLFRTIPADGDPKSHVHELLTLLTEPENRRHTEGLLLDAVTRVAATPDPTTWAVIEHLCADQNQVARELGETFKNISTMKFANLVIGRPSPITKQLSTTPGLTIVSLAGLHRNLPQPGSTAGQWPLTQRVAVACVRGVMTWVTSTMGHPDLRGMPKVAGFPEVQVLTQLDDGGSSLDYIARTGRALDGSLVMDSQDLQAILKLPGLVEQVTTAFLFEQISEAQQAASLDMALLEHTPENYALVAGINRIENGGNLDLTQSDEEPNQIRHGHCIVRDHNSKVGTIQWDIPTSLIQEEISTTPKRNPIKEPQFDMATP